MNSPLLFTQQQHEQASALLARFNQRYLASLEQRPVYPKLDRPVLRALKQEPLPRRGQPLEALFEELECVVVPNSTHTAHPRFLPYVQPSPNALSPYADHVAGALNQNCNLWHLSPAANAVEQSVLRWFSELFGMPGSAGGIITSGGSMANLVALNAARDHASGDQARSEGLQCGRAPLVLYASEEVHSSIEKAVSMLGLGTRYLRHIATDEQFRIRLDLLAQAVSADRDAGLTPFCVVGSAGTVTTGAIDPIEALSQFCREQGLWLHIDGAYGALAALSERFKGPMSAIGVEDSVSLDPHKFLFCAFEAGCVLVRDRRHLLHAFSSQPSYLTMSEDPDFIDFANQGPQLFTCVQGAQGVVVAQALRCRRLRPGDREYARFGQVHEPADFSPPSFRVARTCGIQLCGLPTRGEGRRRQPPCTESAGGRRHGLPRPGFGKRSHRAARLFHEPPHHRNRRETHPRPARGAGGQRSGN